MLDRLIEAARAGESRALVVRGEPGVGKTALLDYQEMAMSAKHTGDEHVVLPPDYDDLEKRLAEGPVITVPTITLEGDANGAPHPDSSSYAKKFSGKYAHRVIKGGIGHNLPQEAPQAFTEAVVEVDGY